jgi:hypothetical protein
MRKIERWRDDLEALALPAFLVWAGIAIIAIVGAALIGSALKAGIRWAKIQVVSLARRLRTPIKTLRNGRTRRPARGST